MIPSKCKIILARMVSPRIYARLEAVWRGMKHHMLYRWFMPLYFKIISGQYKFVFTFSPYQLTNGRPVEGFNSQYGQDQFVATYLYPNEAKMGGGVFVDIGANHPTVISDSFYFENQGWSGLAFEPQKKICDLWKSVRRTPCLPWAIGSSEGEVLFSNVNTDSWHHALACVSSLECRDTSIYAGAAIERTFVRQRRLDTVLQENGNPDINILFIDVEGYEMQVLQGISLNKVNIDVIVIENDRIKFGSKDLRRYILRNNYTFIARICDDDIFVRTGGKAYRNFMKYKITNSKNIIE